jgi:hypothetical protein
MRQLKCMAAFFLHPEAPVQSSGLESARCFFDRYSFSSEDEVNENERAMILADTVTLKQSATHFLHPEKTVVTTDPFACGRNYFTRYNAPNQDASEDERDRILADCIRLKQSAVHYLHPEIKMTSSIACTRNYFTRPSDPEPECDTTVRDEIFQDITALRKVATDYLHPEIPVVTTDGACYGRNYFMRFTAPTQESLDEITQRTEILRDVKLLGQTAKQHLHPELPVVVSDPTVFGRNYFMRASAPDQESVEHFKVREQVLEDTNAFHQLAVEYLHPELPLIIYATATGRNYFTRGSGPEYESLADVEARVEVMEDLKAFKELAREYLHPELPLVVYSTSTGRNYYTRPDAVDTESIQDMEERERIMADVAALKQSAVHFLHPELPVVTKDGTACGRNYFSRFSAPEWGVDTEKDLVLKDVEMLRQAAFDFMHPETRMRSSIACARNYFSRASANANEDLQDAVEREQCLMEARALKKRAVDFMHPEMPVLITDSCVFGRNFFNRFSATESVAADENDHRSQILADAAALKRLATEYLHPELPVRSEVPCTRNYFDRPSAKFHDTMIHTFPAHDDGDDNSDHHHNEHIDHFGLMDEELEMYHDLRAELEAFPIMDSSSNRVVTSKYGSAMNKADDEVGSNLSRSPSSVYLFGMDDAGYE